MFRSWNYYERSPAIKTYDDNHSTTNCSYECDMCTAGWQSETEIYIHRIQEHSKELEEMVDAIDKHPVCLVCLTKYSDVPTLLKHLKTNHLLSSESAQRIEREIFICNECFQIFFNKAMLVIHISMSHKAVLKTMFLECPKCFRKIRRQNLWAHFQFHQVQSVANCPICLTKCNSRKDLQEHVKTHPNYYNCQTCGYDTKKAENFFTHLDKHGTLSEKMDYGNVEAPLRRYFVPRTNFMRRKIRKLGSFDGLTLPAGIRICVLCREICTTVKQMVKHIENHNKTRVVEDKKLHMCSCGEMFFNKVLLKHHVFKMKGDHAIWV